MSLSFSNKLSNGWYSCHESWTFGSWEGYGCLILRKQFFMWPNLFLSVVIADILSAFNWSAIERLIFFDNVFIHTNQKQT